MFPDPLPPHARYRPRDDTFTRARRGSHPMRPPPRDILPGAQGGEVALPARPRDADDPTRHRHEFEDATADGHGDRKVSVSSV